MKKKGSAFLLQPRLWIDKKEKKKRKSLTLYLHAFIHGLLVLLFIWDISYWMIALTLAILHAGIDSPKQYAQKENNRTKWFLIDQGIHIASILIVWAIWLQPTINFSDFTLHLNIWIYATALLFITSESGIVIQVLMTNWSKALKVNDNESLTNAGKYIGILERLFAFIFIVTGHWEGIGFL